MKRLRYDTVVLRNHTMPHTGNISILAYWTIRICKYKQSGKLVSLTYLASMIKVKLVTVIYLNCFFMSISAVAKTMNKLLYIVIYALVIKTIVIHVGIDKFKSFRLKK